MSITSIKIPIVQTQSMSVCPIDITTQILRKIDTMFIEKIVFARSIECP